VTLGLGNSRFTIEMWVKVPAGNQFFSLFSYDKDGEPHALILLYGWGQLWIYKPGGGSIATVADLSDGVWHHVAVTREAVPGPKCEYIFYKDGAQLGGLGISNASCPDIVDGGCVVLGQFQLQKECGGFLDGWAFDGSMTEVRLWKSVRTAAEILSEVAPPRRRIDAAAAASETGLVALWPLNCVYNFDDIKGGQHLSSCSPATPRSGNASYSLAGIVDMVCPCTLVTVKPPTLNSNP
jgi:hypothetical protein